MNEINKQCSMSSSGPHPSGNVHFIAGGACSILPHVGGHFHLCASDATEDICTTSNSISRQTLAAHRSGKKNKITQFFNFYIWVNFAERSSREPKHRSYKTLELYEICDRQNFVWPLKIAFISNWLKIQFSKITRRIVNKHYEHLWNLWTNAANWHSSLFYLSPDGS